MARTTPLVQDDELVHDRTERIVVGSSAWFAWLEQTTTFTFSARQGRFTARKEQSARGGPYWKAYRTQAGKLRRVYLGKSADLTLERMEVAACKLSNMDPGVADELPAEPQPKAAPLPPSRELTGHTASAHLLATKLFIPHLRADLVARPRLQACLDASLDGTLTLVSAPAGFGKTTVLSQWVHSSVRHRRAIAWLALDAADRDPLLFLRYFIAAIRTISPSAGESALALLRASPPSALNAALTLLVNDLVTLPPTLLVLDDYHVIDVQSTHDALAWLVDYLPAQIHLAIASRADPPLPLARWRARAVLEEVRAAALRFTPEEVQAFLRETMRLNLQAHDLAALEQRTEGWIAGLHLAALALRGSADPAGFIAAFTGSHRYILDYFADEVLQQQPDHVQTFLLVTSILDRMCSQLCEAVSGVLQAHGDSHMLEVLERANLFVIPLDEERRWYRYYPLFADMLRYRLQQIQPDRVPELHRRASIWFEHNGTLAEAIRHAFAARDLARAAGLVEQHGRTMLSRGEVMLLLNWLQALPDTVIYSRPQLAVMLARALLITGQWKAIEHWCRAADSAVSTEAAFLASNDIEAIGGTVAAIRSAVAINSGDEQRAIKLSRQALRYLPEHDFSMRCLVALNLGAAYWQGGDLVAASQAYVDASTIGQAGDQIQAAMLALHYLAKLHAIQGQLHKVADTCRQAHRYAATYQHSDSQQSVPPAAVAYLGMGELLRERNELSASEEHLGRAMALCQHWGHIDVLVDGYVMLARLQLAQGKLQAALVTFDRADTLVQTHSLSFFLVSEVAACRVRLWLAKGHTELALNWARDAGLAVHAAPSYAREVEYITFARVLLAAGRGEEALLLLQRLRDAAVAGSRTGRVIEILVLEAVALQRQGKNYQALATLTTALSLAKPEGYIRIFVDEGASMQAMLEAVCNQPLTSTTRAYVDGLLTAFGSSAGGEAEAQELPPPAPALNLLSPRELDVLRLIAAGRSNAMIAHDLVVALSTVKKHINNLYAKLHVRNRVEAIARARKLQLL